MDVFGALFQFGKHTNGCASRLVEEIVHFQQECMVALDNQRVVGLKARWVVHAPASDLCSRKFVCLRVARQRTQSEATERSIAEREHGVAIPKVLHGMAIVGLRSCSGRCPPPLPEREGASR